MENILNTPFKIKTIVINNFIVPLDDISIQLIIYNESDSYKFSFDRVTQINIDRDYYGVSDNPSITIEDVSSLQWENINYRVQVMEEVMSFYCESYTKIKDNDYVFL